MRFVFNIIPFRLFLCLASLLLLWGCFGEKESEPAKDLVNFSLPESVNAQAPDMEAHLLRMVVYNSGRFPIKPGFVFIDDGQLTMGAPEIKINRLNMLHLAYSVENQPEWSGSLVHAVGAGAHVFSSRGYSISLRPEADNLHVTFRDGGTVFELDIKVDQDMEQKLDGNNGSALYINHYVFPEELVARGRQVGRKTKPKS